MCHVHVQPTPKRFALGMKQFTTTENQERELTEYKFKRHYRNLLGNEKDKYQPEHINMHMLLTATLVERRKWISTLPPGLISPTLKKFHDSEKVGL